MSNSLWSLAWRLDQVRGIRAKLQELSAWLVEKGFEEAANAVWDETFVVHSDDVQGATRAYEKGFEEAKRDAEYEIAVLEKELEIARERYADLQLYVAKLEDAA